MCKRFSFFARPFIPGLILGVLLTTPPATAATIYSDVSIPLTWAAATGNPEFYNVYVSDNSNNYTFVGTTPTTSYTLTGANQHTYQIKVQAADSKGNMGPMSDASEPITVQITHLLSFNQGNGQNIYNSRNQVVGYLGSSVNTDKYDPQWSPDGLGGTYCLKFNPSSDRVLDYVQITDPDVKAAKDRITVSMCVKLFQGGPNNAQYGFYKKGSQDSFGFYTKKGQLYAYVMINGVSKSVSSSRFQTAAWQHIAATFDGKTIKLYLQGTLVGSQNFDTLQSMANMTEHFIGYNFYGLIDEVTLVPGTVWSDAEVLAEYQRVLPPSPPAAPLALKVPAPSDLLQNYPNPFNPETWVPYRLAAPSNVTIAIYDVSGHQIRSLNLGYQAAGSYTTRNRAAYWDGRNDAGEFVGSGVYFYHLQAGDYQATKKMILLK